MLLCGQRRSEFCDEEKLEHGTVLIVISDLLDTKKWGYMQLCKPDCSIYIYIYIYIYHHVVPLARISLTLSRHFSLSFIASGRSSGLHPVSSHSCWMYVRAGRPAFARPYVRSIGVHNLWARPCFYSSVLHVWFL